MEFARINTCAPLRVEPDSRRARLQRSCDGARMVWLHWPPAEGGADRGLIERLAEYFQAPRTPVRILSDSGCRIKLVEIG